MTYVSPANPSQTLYVTETEARTEAKKLNAARKRTTYEYGCFPVVGGWQICFYCDD